MEAKVYGKQHRFDQLDDRGNYTQLVGADVSIDQFLSSLLLWPCPT